MEILYPKHYLKDNTNQEKEPRMNYWAGFASTTQMSPGDQEQSDISLNNYIGHVHQNVSLIIMKSALCN